tara:strand:- start:2426 stop:3259 length:834 start_codon:yes stop_codon:yes gene_type:complete
MSRSYKFLNVACGDTFIEDDSWINIDFTSHSPIVKKANILDGLPYEDNTFDVVYSSHFIEHIPVDQIELFFDDVYRILKPGGLIRLVTPDLEFLNNEYKINYDKKAFKKANFITSLTIDQCVRSVSGGKLKKDMDNFYNSNDTEMIDYIKLLIGPDAFEYVDSNDISFIKKVLIKVKKDPKFIFNILFMIRVKIFSFFLPKSFRELNLSNASIGEKHMWLYDFNSLSEMLKNSSFININRTNFNESNYYNYIFSKLDIKNSLPRKGIHQLFVEALKN